MNLLVNLDVDDLEKGVRFYTSAFGLSVGRRIGEAVVELVGAPVPIYLLLKESGTLATNAAAGQRRYERHWTPVHLDFVTEDIELAVATAVTSGAKLEKPIATQRWGRLALMADPFGHGFCFVQFLGRGYDEIAD